MTKNKIVKELIEEQDKLRKKFMNRITKQRKSIYDYRGVWISVQCACGHKYRTPHWIRPNGICVKCNRYVFRETRKQHKISEE